MYVVYYMKCNAFCTFVNLHATKDFEGMNLGFFFSYFMNKLYNKHYFFNILM